MSNRVLASSLVVCAALIGSGAWAQEAVSVAGADVAVPSPVQKSGSGVRIVRLSEVRGVVRMDRNTGRGYEAAFANIPVVAGAKLSTGGGVAEVEFEDNSSLRLAPETQVVFTELSRMPTGGTVTTVDVVKGVAYASLEKTKGNAFTLTDGGAKLVLMPGAHLRLDARQPQVQVAMFDGSAELNVGSATTLLGKHQTIDLNPAAGTVAAVVRGTEEQDFDAWDKQERDYHRQKASLTGTGGFGLYGANDLNYYGSFVDMPGCGSMWRPYFANAAWDPFGSGVWAYYPSAGYSWVSPYPWGWLPYHSGTWASCGGAGWGWRPGGSWYGVNNLAALQVAGRPMPHPMPTGPVRNASTLVPVNMTALPQSGVAKGDRFEFRQNSAGLGVPRAEYGNLHGVAQHVNVHGVATSGVSANTMAAQTSTRAGSESYAGRLPGTTAAGRMGGPAGNSASAGPARAGSAGNAGNAGGMRSGSMSMPSAAPAASAPAPSAGAGGGARH